MRIGHGYDAHRFADGRRLILGGVEIPHHRGLAAHSDGDAVLHALCDALLGAAALGDIGGYFPDTDASFENIDSRVLLRKVAEMVKGKGYVLCNADITVLAQEPKLAEFITFMRYNIAHDLGIDVDSINIKATTTEGMGFIGKKEGIAAYAVVLIGAN
ncbi:MAG: 2-C-methyl-D-erythritol 2,4-cyclodiphosphate synthase [Gammaproteobacteria bacterium]|jgi:2-C-methyl-D-erythritol 2,4-cyclodiphosphate synthase